MKSLNLQLINQVEEICSARGVRLTTQRKRVFELICANPKASSAYELLEKLQQSEPQAKPPTVYRALDFLLEQGFVHRVESTNSYIQCVSCNADKHFSHLLICNKCNKVIELQDNNLIALLVSNAKLHGFTINNHVIESHGTCQNCTPNDVK